MKQLTWSPRSRQDLLEIAEYDDRLDPLLAEQIVDRISQASLPLIQSPEIGSLTASGARKWRVPKTPYLLLYDVTDAAVEVVTVRHVRSDWSP